MQPSILRTFPHRWSSGRGRSALLRALPVASVVWLGLSGCTVLNIQGADGQVSVEHRAGLLLVQPRAGAQPLVLHSTSLGWQAGPGGRSLGFASTRLVMMPEGCRVIVMARPDETVSAAELQALADRQLCLVSDSPPESRPRGGS